MTPEQKEKSQWVTAAPLAERIAMHVAAGRYVPLCKGETVNTPIAEGSR